MQDERIVELYWQRDESAIWETEQKYGPYLSKIAYNILSDLEDSKESVNDTYMKIGGSWGDGYAPMVALLDWVWEHPVDFGMFTMEKGVEITSVQLADCPEAFAEQLPHFESLGYFLGEHSLQLKDGVPYTFEGHYYTGITPEQTEDGSYFEMDGWTEIHWCIDAQPDYYDLKNCIGNISELEQGQVIETLAENSNFSFLVNGVFIKVYCKDAAEAWKAVESIK